MSGGQYDYVYMKVNDFLDSLQVDKDSNYDSEYHGKYINYELRKKFKTHLELVSKAMKAVEWNDSGDGDEDEISILKQILREP